MSVFVLDKRGLPLMPCTEKRARLLLERNRARIHKLFPFTIRLVDRYVETCELQDIEVKIDPGSKFTGICISRTVDRVVNVLNLFELVHRENMIKKALLQRAMYRRNRRNRNTRYRPSRFLNRTRKAGWLQSSLMHRVDTTISWTKRFIKYLPVTQIIFERVKFDMQKMQNASISGIEYQQGTLYDKEVMEYLLEKYKHKCVYCNVTDVTFEKEHVLAKCNGGTNRISNLVLSCIPCNRKKGSQYIETFLFNKPELLKQIKSNLKKPLKDAAAVNATRNRLFSDLLKLGLPVETGSGALTKYNRTKFNIPKTHALDAACVGDIKGINEKAIYVKHIEIKCSGRGRYQRTLTDKYGFPRVYLMKTKSVFGFQTGDIVRTTVKVNLQYKEIIGKVSVRINGSFSILYNNRICGVPSHRCKLIQKYDGYNYGVRDYKFLSTNNRILTLIKEDI